MTRDAEHLSDETLDRLRAGLLAGEQARAARAHLEACPACRARARPWADLAEPVSPAAAAALAEGRRRALAAARRPAWRRPLLAVAAALTLAVGVGLFARLQPLQSPPPAEARLAAADPALFAEIDFYVWLDQEAGGGRQETL